MPKISCLKIALGLALAGLGMNSCGLVASRYIPGSQAAAAKDQVMLVRSAPPSFGYERLVTRCTEFHDLSNFVTKHGDPDFLAETGSRERPYLIFYYLDRRSAFVCRTKAENFRAIEFAGPYPVTDKEYKLLSSFRATANQRHAEGAD